VLSRKLQHALTSALYLRKCAFMLLWSIGCLCLRKVTFRLGGWCFPETRGAKSFECEVRNGHCWNRTENWINRRRIWKSPQILQRCIRDYSQGMFLWLYWLEPSFPKSLRASPKTRRGRSGLDRLCKTLRPPWNIHATSWLKAANKR
jgi:hypothetical protein